MAEYIDVQAAIDEIYKRCAGEHWEDILKSLEPAKVRPIIYCHECKWFYVGEDQKCCINHKGVVVTDEDGFCHHAELRVDEEE